MDDLAASQATITDRIEVVAELDKAARLGSRGHRSLPYRALRGIGGDEMVDAVSRATLNLRSIWGHAHYLKFIVLGIARTGSSLLVDLLAAHSHVIAFGEVFRAANTIGWDLRPFTSFQEPGIVRLYQEQPVAFLRKAVFRRWPRDIGAVGFKLFYYHARTGPHLGIWEFLRNDETVRIIHLKRRNILAQLYSLRVAHKTDIWSSKREMKGPTPNIRFSVGECREHFESVRRFEEETASYFSAHAINDVYYEDLVKDPNRVLASVQEFLGLERRSASSTLVRQRRNPLSQSIENFEELGRFFSGSPWGQFFRDDE